MITTEKQSDIRRWPLFFIVLAATTTLFAVAGFVLDFASSQVVTSDWAGIGYPEVSRPTRLTTVLYAAAVGAFIVAVPGLMVLMARREPTPDDHRHVRGDP